jgi:hypothetical protein
MGRVRKSFCNLGGMGCQDSENQEEVRKSEIRRAGEADFV